MSSEKPLVEEVLNYYQDIEPYKYIKIYAGVGSGKTRFACKMILGDKDLNIPDKTVLLITSRRAKVAETLSELGAHVKSFVGTKGNLSQDVWNTGEYSPYEYEKYIRVLDYEDEDGFKDNLLVYNQSAVCTNAYISAYIKYQYDESDPQTHLWNLFDIIIVDEVHSLATDATYQYQPFLVAEFLKETIRRMENPDAGESTCKNLILMTGTPEPYEECLSIDFPTEKLKTYDLRSVCKNVMPKKVLPIDMTSAINTIHFLLNCGEKIIYFSAKTLSVQDVMKKFFIDDPSGIGVSFSKEEKRKGLAQEDFDEMERIEDSLAKDHMLPSDIQFFVTTSRYREGVNIENKDIRYMFVESRIGADIIQMAGRVRNGLEKLYIINGAPYLSAAVNELDVDFTCKYMVKHDEPEGSINAANEYLKLITGNDVKRKTESFIEYIEKRFDFVRYNYFTQCFCFYDLKLKAMQWENDQLDKFGSPKSFHKQLINQWFPDSEFYIECPAIFDAYELIYALLPFRTPLDDSYIECQLTAEAKENLQLGLEEILHTGYKTLSKILEYVSPKLGIRRKSTDSRSPDYCIWILSEGDIPYKPKKKSMGPRKRKTR